MTELTTEQQAIFDAEIESLWERLERRRAIMALPSLKQRANALKGLWVAIEGVRRAAAAKPLRLAWIVLPSNGELARRGASCRGRAAGTDEAPSQPRSGARHDAPERAPRMAHRRRNSGASRAGV